MLKDYIKTDFTMMNLNDPFALVTSAFWHCGETVVAVLVENKNGTSVLNLEKRRGDRTRQPFLFS